MFNVFHKRSSPTHRRRRRSKSMHERTLHYEVLELRVVPSGTYTWTGGGVNSNWSTGANWQGGVAPTSASTLVFGSGKSQLTNIDDISGLSVAEIVLSGGYSISGSAITVTGSGGVGIDSQTGTNAFNNPITLGASLTFTEDAGQLTLGGVITGSQSLTEVGPGTLVLSAVNTYSGTTTIIAGTISISADTNLGTAPVSATPGSLTINGGTLATTAGMTLNANRGISLGAPGGTIDVVPGTLTYNGIVAGPGGLTKMDGGTLVLGGVNTYSGGTTISSGVLSISADNNLGNAPVLPTPGSLIVNRSTLVTTASFTLNPNRGINIGSTFGGTLDPAAGTTLTYNGIIAGAGDLGPKTNTGTLVLGGANTYGGATRVRAGTLQDGIANALPVTTTLTVSGTGIFDLGGFAQSVGGLADGGVTTGTVTDSGAAATFTVNNGATNTFSGLLTNGANALSLTKTGAGTLTLSHANTYSGVTTISAGTISISADTNLGTAPVSATPGSLAINGGTLATTASFTLNANRGISLGTSGGTFDTSPGSTLTYNGIATGPGGSDQVRLRKPGTRRRQYLQRHHDH